jgi:hypothetical protein
MFVKAARLQDADAPIEMYHSFLEKQRQMFVDQRKSHAAAIEFLHQYRADDELVLRETIQRHSTGGSVGRKSLSPSQTPDARAAVYSSYPTILSYPPTRPNNSGENSNNYPSPLSTIVATDRSTIDSFIQASPIEFEKVLVAMQNLAKEAARVPLPQDDEDLPVLIVEATSAPRSCDVGEEPEVQDTPPSDTISTNHSIPFESFLKLGESQIAEQGSRLPVAFEGYEITSDVYDDEGSEHGYDGYGNEKFIPGVSFMNLGASMLAEALSTTPKSSDMNGDDNVDDDDSTAPLTEPGRSQMDDSGVVIVDPGHQSTTTTATATPATSITIGTPAQNAPVIADSSIEIRIPSATDVPCQETEGTAIIHGMENDTFVLAMNTNVSPVREGGGNSTKDWRDVDESKAGVNQPETYRQNVLEASPCRATLPEEGNDAPEEAANITIDPSVAPEPIETVQLNNVLDPSPSRATLPEGGDDASIETANNAIATSALPESLECVNVAFSHSLVDCSLETERKEKEAETVKVRLAEVISNEEIAPTLNACTRDSLPTNEQTTPSTRTMGNGLNHVEAEFDSTPAVERPAAERRSPGTSVRRREQPKPVRKKEKGYYPSSSLFVARQYFSR